MTEPSLSALRRESKHLYHSMVPGPPTKMPSTFDLEPEDAIEGIAPVSTDSGEGLTRVESKSSVLRRRSGPRRLSKVSSSDSIIHSSVLEEFIANISKQQASEAPAPNLSLAAQTTTVSEWGKRIRALSNERDNAIALEMKESATKHRQRMGELVKHALVRKGGHRTIVLAAVESSTERYLLKKTDLREYLKAENTVIPDTERDRSAMASARFEWFRETEEDIHSVFSEGQNQVTRFGSLLSEMGRARIQDYREIYSLSLQMEKNSEVRMDPLVRDSNRAVLQALLGFKNGQALSHRRLVLNSLTLSEGHSLSQDKLTVVHMDNPVPASARRWCTVCATDGPWLVRRNQNTSLNKLIDETKDLAHQVALPKLVKTLARILDFAHPSYKLHAEVLANPAKSRALVQNRLDQLGYDCEPDALLDSDVQNAKRNVIHVLDQIYGRMCNYYRFYYEVEVSQCTTWRIGWTCNPLMESEWAGCDAFSYALSQDGRVWHNGFSSLFYKSIPTRPAIVGCLIDLVAGNLVFYVDGIELGTGFGPDAEHFSEDERKEQGVVLRRDPVVPMFSMLGLEGKESASRKWVSAAAETSGSPDMPKLISAVAKSKPLKPEIVQIQPTLVANFGALPFQHLPTGSFSCESSISFTELAHRHIPYSVEGGATTDRHFTHTPSILSEFSHLEEDDDRNCRGHDEFVYDFLQDTRQNHYTETGLLPGSWSAFPPGSHRLELAARVIQRLTRTFLRRVNVRRLAKRRQIAAISIQAWYRFHIPLYRIRRGQAAIRIQSSWRRYKARILFNIIKAYSGQYHVVRKAVDRISFFYLRRKAALFAAMAVEAQKQEKLRIMEREKAEEAHRHVLATKIQALWRGYRHRKQIPDHMRALLCESGQNLLQGFKEWRAAILMQRMIRGHLDRVFVQRKRRNYSVCALILQRNIRGFLARSKMHEEFDIDDVELLQSIAVRIREAEGDITRLRQRKHRQSVVTLR